MTTISLEPKVDVAPNARPTPPRPATGATAETEPATAPPVLRLNDVHFYYGAFRAVKDVNIDIPTHQITALIGPSGCGKSTLLRTMNRMNDLIPGTRVTGRLEYHGEDLYAPRWTRSRFAVGSAWSSRSRTRSRSRSTTTSPSARV